MKRYNSHFIALGLYTLLTLILTWPWAANFGSAFPGSATWAFDESTFVWNIWRFKHNLLDLGASPLHTTDIFWPLGIDLTLYTYNFLNALLGLPLLLGINLPLASNATLLLAYVLSGYGTYLLILYLLPKNAAPIARRGAAFAGGAIYAFLASRAIFAALGHYDIVSTEFIPFFTLFFIKSLREPGFKNPILAGIFAALCLLAEMIFGVFLLFLGLILIADHLRQQTAPRSPFAIRLLALGATAALIWSPVMLPILRAFAQGNFALTGWGESLKLSADLVGWFTPTALHPLWGADWATRLREVQEGSAPFNDVNTVFLGYGALALALAGAMAYRKRLTVWIAAALIFAVFTLGPLLQIKGQFLFALDNLLREQGIAQDITFPLPFALLHYIPVINANRVPARFSVVLGLSLATLAGFGAFWILRRIKKRSLLVGVTALLTVLVLFDVLSVPLPLTAAGTPDVYAKIGAEEADFTLLQLPLGWRNSFGVYGAERTQIQYYQHVHQKPMLGGNISRAPAFKFDYYRNIPLFQAIAQTELPQSDPAVSAETLEKAKQQAADLMTLYNVGYVVIHQPIPGRKPYADTFTATRQLIFELLPLENKATYLSPEAAAYKVNRPPVPKTLRLEFGDWPSAPYRGEGWGGDELYQGAGVNWSTAPESRIFFPYQGRGDRKLSIHLIPFGYAGAPPQTMKIVLNETYMVGAYSLREEWQVLEATLPAKALRPGLNRLTLQFSRQAIPREALPADTAIGGAGVNAPLDIEINSHADFSFITVGFGAGAADASAHRRGFNVAVLNPQSGQVLDKKGFDTAANPYEAEALRKYIAQIPAGQIVLVSSKGADAAAFLSEGFAALGGSKDLPGVPYSLIGVKGAAEGSALERFGEAYLRLGKNQDTRPLSAAVDWVEIQAE